LFILQRNILLLLAGIMLILVEQKAES